MKTPPRIRIFLLDDHPVVRSGIAAVIAGESDMEIIGEAETIQQAIEAFNRGPPDVALFDLMLPDGNGIELARQLRTVAPATRFIVLTARAAVGDVNRARAAGVHGYLFKSARRTELLNAIRIVAMGGRYVSPSAEQETSQDRAGTDLTPRELDVLRSMSRGLDNHQIARLLRIGEETVKSHSKNVLLKLGVGSRSQAAALCWKLGLMDGEGS